METQSSQSSPQTVSPWLAIWTKPRETIRRIVDDDPSHQVVLLAVLAGIGQALDRAASRSTGDTLSLPVILAICAVAGPLGGLVSLYISGALLHWTGRKFFGGQASSEEVRAAVAWSLVPRIFSSALWIPELALFGTEMFTSATPRIDSNLLLAVLLLGVAGIKAILLIWYVVVFFKCVGEVHRFSAWKALASLSMSALILFVPVFVVGAISRIITVSP